MDEFGVNIHMRRTQEQSAKGQRVYRKISGQKRPNVTICCAVSTESLLYYQVIQGGMKKKIFKYFFEVLYGKIILDEGNDADGFCNFDNAPGHRRIEDIDLSGLFSLKRLPK